MSTHFITDAMLLADTRSPERLRSELYADTILRLARLRKLGRFTRVDDALAAIGAAQEAARVAAAPQVAA